MGDLPGIEEEAGGGGVGGGIRIGVVEDHIGRLPPRRAPEITGYAASDTGAIKTINEVFDGRKS